VGYAGYTGYIFSSGYNTKDASYFVIEDCSENNGKKDNSIVIVLMNFMINNNTIISLNICGGIIVMAHESIAHANEMLDNQDLEMMSIVPMKKKKKKKRRRCIRLGTLEETISGLVKDSGHMLQFADTQNNEMCVNAVKNYPDAVNHIHIITSITYDIIMNDIQTYIEI
jgi:hypothetical protein